MSPETAGSLLVAVLAGIALAAATGLRAFLPLLVVGLAARGGVFHLNPDFAFLSGNVALVALAVATVVEVAGDKVPVLDHVLDVGGTFVRPAAAFLAGLAVLGRFPEPVAVALALFFAVISLGTHLGHAKTRVGSTVMTAGIGNPFLSFLEDGIAAALSVLAVLAPLVAALLVAGLAVLVWRLVGRLRRRGGRARVD